MYKQIEKMMTWMVEQEMNHPVPYRISKGKGKDSEKFVLKRKKLFGWKKLSIHSTFKEAYKMYSHDVRHRNWEMQKTLTMFTIINELKDIRKELKTVEL